MVFAARSPGEKQIPCQRGPRNKCPITQINAEVGGGKIKKNREAVFYLLSLGALRGVSPVEGVSGIRRLRPGYYEAAGWSGGGGFPLFYFYLNYWSFLLGNKEYSMFRLLS
jgi:hypothetical protein